MYNWFNIRSAKKNLHYKMYILVTIQFLNVPHIWIILANITKLDMCKNTQKIVFERTLKRNKNWNSSHRNDQAFIYTVFYFNRPRQIFPKKYGKTVSDKSCSKGATRWCYWFDLWSLDGHMKIAFNFLNTLFFITYIHLVAYLGSFPR